MPLNRRLEIKVLAILVFVSIVFCCNLVRPSERKATDHSDGREPQHELSHIVPGRTRFLLDDDTDNCSKPDKHKGFADSCSFVRATCESEAGLFDYLQFVFCDLRHVKPLAYVIIGLWLLLLISLLATTADYFFVPPLYLLAEKLHLSPSIAGITLLAIGNGAPDVFTAYAALQASSDFPLLLGALIGASIFISTVVLGSVILMTKVTKDTINPIDFTRDVVTYLIVVGTVVAIAFDGSVHLYEAVVFLLIYLLYIVVVVAISYARKYYARRKKQPPRFNPGKREPSPLLVSKIEGSVVEVKSTTLTESANGISMTFEDPFSATNNGLPALSYPKHEHIGVKIQWFVEWPFSLLRWFTVPPCYHDGKWDGWRHWFVISSPMPMAMLLLLTAKGTDGFTVMIANKFPLYQLLLLIGLVISVAAYFVVPSRRPPHWGLQIVLGALAFIMSICWLNLEANECIAILEAFGLIFDIDTAILGLTVLAIGNSVGDWVADTAVARAGHPSMGVASCFGSPLLNDVLGLGIALTSKIATDNGRTFRFNIDDQEYDKVKLSWIFLGISLIASVIIFPLFRFSPPKVYGVVLIYIYIVFMVFSILNEVGVMNITL